MERNIYDRLLPEKDNNLISDRHGNDKKIKDETRKSVEDTKRKIRDAFSNSEKMKASIRA